MPVIAPKPPARPKQKSLNRLISIPMRLAPVRLTAEALRAFPNRVRFKKSESPMVTMTRSPKTQRTCDVIVAPNRWITSVSKKESMRLVSDPQAMRTKPLMTEALAMVIIIYVTSLGCLTGRMAIRSRIIEIRIVKATAKRMEGTRLKPAVRKTHVSIPPSMTNSPVVKFRTFVIRYTTLQHIPTTAYMLPLVNPEIPY